MLAMRFRPLGLTATIRASIGKYDCINSRTLFSQAELGVLGLTERRENALRKCGGFANVQEYKQNISDSFSTLQLDQQRDELKDFIYITDLSQNDVDSLKQMLRLYGQMFNEIIHKVGEFCFSTEIIRTCHLLGKPHVALQFFQDGSNKLSFQQSETYKAYLDLLLEHRHYEELIECYDEIRRSLSVEGKTPIKALNCLVLAACYHLNTPERYQYASKLWKSLHPDKEIKRSTQIMAALALKQGDIYTAEQLVQGQSENYATIRFLNLAIFTAKRQFIDALKLIKKVLDQHQRGFVRQLPTFSEQLIDDLEKAMWKEGTVEEVARFDELKRQLVAYKLLTNETLHDRLCAEFPPREPRNVYLRQKFGGRLDSNAKYT